MTTMKSGFGRAALGALLASAPALAAAEPPAFAIDAGGAVVTLTPGHPSLQGWHISRAVKAPVPVGNETTPERVSLGRQLFFDPRVSSHGRTSCASCHDPARGFGDGVPGSVRYMGEIMTRNSPSIFDLAYRPVLMWDGRNVAKDGLGAAEHQAIGSQSMTGSMAAGSVEAGLAARDRPDPAFANAGAARIRQLEGYRTQFAKAYPGEPIDQKAIAKALAAFQRGVVSEDTRFDRFVAGEAPLSEREVHGLRVFIDRDKGNCVACHQAPLFSDGLFHNIGLPSEDRGRFDPSGKDAKRASPALKGAFLTPPLRQTAETAPYFHDGSARTLMDVMQHYQRGGVVRTNLSPHIRPLALTQDDMEALVAFMKTLSSPYGVVTKHDRPPLPRN